MKKKSIRSLKGLFLSLLFLRLMPLNGDIVDHLKKIDTCSCHHLGNIDYIYLINLEERAEKFCQCLKELVPYGIIPHRFSAINGWKLPIETINDLGVKYGHWMNGSYICSYYSEETGLTPQNEPIETPGKTYFGHRVFPGAIATVLSHLSVLQHAYDSGFETIWVMEDDIQVLKDPRILPDLIDRLDQLVGKEGWDILFTDKDTKGTDGKTVLCSSYGWRPNFIPKDPQRFAHIHEISSEFRQVGARYGSYSMIIRRSGMKKLLNFIKQYQIFLPYDMEYTLPNDIRLFTVLDDVVTTYPTAPSDNAAANYINKE